MPKKPGKKRWSIEEKDRESMETINKVEKYNIDWKDRYIQVYTKAMLKTKYGINPSKEVRQLDSLGRRLEMNKARKAILELNDMLYRKVEEDSLSTMNLAYLGFSRLRNTFSRREIHEMIEKWGDEGVREVWRLMLSNGGEFSEKHLSEEHVEKKKKEFIEELRSTLDKVADGNTPHAIMALAVKHSIFLPEAYEAIIKDPKVAKKVRKKIGAEIKKLLEGDELDYIR